MAFVDSWTGGTPPDYSWHQVSELASVYHNVICNDSTNPDNYLDETMIPDFVVDQDGMLYIYAQTHYELWGCEIAVVPLVEFQPPEL
jgi:hypothetical protein